MSNNGLILQQLIEEDFGIRGRNRWFRSEEKSSLVLDFNKGIFFYNKEGVVGDPLVYLVRMRKMSFSDARDYLVKLGYSETFVYTINGTRKEDVLVYPRLVEIFYEQGINKRDYFYERTLIDSTLDRFQCGWYNDYNVIPFFEGGTFRNFQMRTDTPIKRIKSYYKGIGPLLFNEDVLRLTDEVYYVEGPVDAMVLAQAGIPAVSSNCGGGYKPEWLVKFNKQKRVNICFDNDSAGEKESKKLAGFLGKERCRIYTFSDFEDEHYDPTDYFKDGNDGKNFIKLIEDKSKKVY